MLTHCSPTALLLPLLLHTILVGISRRCRKWLEDGDFDLDEVGCVVLSLFCGWFLLIITNFDIIDKIQQ